MALTPTPNANAPAPSALSAPADPVAFPYLLLVGLGLIPLLAASFLVGLIGPLGNPLTDDELAVLRTALTAEPFLPGALSLIAVLCVHVCVCLAGLWLGSAILRRHYRSWLTPAAMAAAGVLILLFILCFASEDRAVYRLSYYFFIQLYEGTGAAASFLHPRMGSLDALTLAVLLPVGLGIIGLSVMGSAALGEVQAVGTTAPSPGDLAYEAKLLLAYSRVKRYLYLMSIGLVTSTVAASLFFHLPSKLSVTTLPGAPSALSASFDSVRLPETQLLLKNAEVASNLAKLRQTELAGIRTKFDAFAAELSIFWAAVFTLTLIIVGGLPMAILQTKVGRYTEPATDLQLGQTALARLNAAGLSIGWTGQAKLLLALLAPLVTAPLSNFVQSWSSL